MCSSDLGIVNGMLSIAIDPARFAGGAGGEADYDALMDYVKGCAAIDPAAPVLVAGDPERRTREERLRDGIPIPDTLARQLRDACVVLDNPEDLAVLIRHCSALHCRRPCCQSVLTSGIIGHRLPLCLSGCVERVSDLGTPTDTIFRGPTKTQFQQSAMRACG